MAITPLIISNPVYQAFHPTTGAKLAGGKLYHYSPGTETTKALYTTYTAKSTYAHADPIVLDADGKATIYGSGSYDFHLYDASDNLIEGPKRVTIIPVSDFALTLLDDTSAAAMRATLGLGTAATKDTGTGAGNVLIFVTSNTLPALDGSLLTDFTDAQIYNTPRGYIAGLTITPSTTSISVAAGACRNAANSGDLVLSSAFSKTTSAWAVDTGSGGLDTGTIANTTWYHVYLIEKTSDETVDVLFSASASAPTMPTGYSNKRRIGSVLTDGSAQFVTYLQWGDIFTWSTPVVAGEGSDNYYTLGTARENVTLKVPTGVRVLADFVVFSTGEPNKADIYLSCPDVTDVAPTIDGSAPIFNAWTHAERNAYEGTSFTCKVLTNTSGQVGARVQTGTPQVYFCTYGWIDRRGVDD